VLLSCSVANAQDLARALAQPLSPGSVALLTYHPGEPAVVDRWTAALKDERPEVRAAAARVINTSGAGTLVQSLKAALAVEQDHDAAREEILALAALGGKVADDALLQAAGRFPGWGSAFVASAIARARGSEALSLPPELRNAGLKSDDSFLSWATRGGADGLTTAASTAVRDGDAAAWEAVLKLARRSGADVDAEVILAALGRPDDALRAETYWHLALVQYAQGKLDDRVTSALAAVERPADLAVTLTLELLQRTLGRKPVELADWMKALDQQKKRAPYATRLLVEPTLLRYLERRELEALSLATRGDAKALRDVVKLVSDPKLVRAEPRRGVLVAPSIDGASVATVGGFPKGFVLGVLQASGCDPAAAHGVALGKVLFGPDGRPQRTALTDSQTSAKLGGPPECTDAARVLLGSTLGARWRPEQEKTLLVVLDPEVLGCMAELPVELSRSISITEDSSPSGELKPGEITPPRKTRNVPPVYPANAKDQRIQGVVILEAIISPTGCIRTVEVLRGVPALNWEAVRAVMQWRYTPTLLNGVAVPVIMTVTVNFRLQ
jgi:TonB family protein